MEHYEMAEILSKKAGVSLEEARSALEENNWDMLDAMIALERGNSGKTAQPVVVPGAQSHGSEQPPAAPQPVRSTADGGDSFKKGLAKLWEYIKKLLRMMIETDFIISRRGSEKVRVPVLVLVILLIFCFWLVPIALIVGLFLGCSYRFEGKGKVSDTANRAMDKLKDAVDDVKDAFESEKK